MSMKYLNLIDLYSYRVLFRAKGNCMLRYLRKFLQKCKERFYPHQITKEEIELVRNNALFSNIDEETLQLLIGSGRVGTFPSDKLLIKKGEIATQLYFIKKGSVRVFDYDSKGVKVALVRLNEGDSFGEHALVGYTLSKRNAYVETITPCELLIIPYKAIKKLTNLLALDSTLHHFRFYERIDSILPKINDAKLVKFEDGHTIFNAGDEPDFIYIILSGKVNLLTRDPNTGKIHKSMIYREHLFGELGVLGNEVRKATAVAVGDVHLLAIDRPTFDKYFSEDPQIKEILNQLKITYKIPLRGRSVEQFCVYNEQHGPEIVSCFHLENGREVKATHAIQQNYYNMEIVGENIGEKVTFTDGNEALELFLQDKRLIRINARGVWGQLPTLCGLLLDEEPIGQSAISSFEKTGKIAPSQSPKPSDENQIICDCMSVTKGQIKELIRQGATTLASISDRSGACTACGACKFRIAELLGISSSLLAKMKKEISHNSYINSYSIKLDEGTFSDYKPGQHVVIQVKVGSNLIERPYTISSMSSEGNSLRLTIKKEPQGYFTNWLFNMAPSEFEIHATHPQGSFIFDQNQDSLCFAGGIGITPFLALVEALLHKKNNSRTFLIYTALTTSDFICREFLDKAVEDLSSLSIRYKATNDEGFLAEEEILNAVRSMNKPNIYICGPKPFLKLIQETLKKEAYDPSKIFIEQFLHAGGK